MLSSSSFTAAFWSTRVFLTRSQARSGSSWLSRLIRSHQQCSNRQRQRYRTGRRGHDRRLYERYVGMEITQIVFAIAIDENFYTSVEEESLDLRPVMGGLRIWIGHGMSCTRDNCSWNRNCFHRSGLCNQASLFRSPNFHAWWTDLWKPPLFGSIFTSIHGYKVFWSHHDKQMPSPENRPKS